MTDNFVGTVGHAHGVFNALKARPDVRPDLVVAHSGFGSSLFLPHLYDCPVVNFFEYFHRPRGQTLGYRPDVPLSEQALLRSRTSNAMILLDLDNCDAGWCPNYAQRATFPAEYQSKLRVIPEGVDTNLYRRNELAPRRIPGGAEIGRDTRVVTYVSRGFELTRGFDVFLRAAKLILERFPDVLFVVVGTDRTYYGPDRRLTGGASLRERLLEASDLDLSRVHFTGWVPEQTLAELLSISDLHIYLTLPFITSWSMLDAMSCGCVVLASDQDCTREYITHERNGLLCGFFDVDGIAERAVQVLKDPAGFRDLGTAARRTIEDNYSLDASMPRLKAFFEEVSLTPRRPTLRAEALTHSTTCEWSTDRRREAANGVDEWNRDQPLPPFEGTLPFSVDRDPGLSREAPEGTASAGIGGSFESRPRTLVPKVVLFAWEVGAGWGHLMQMRPLVQDLAAAGYCVVVALRYLDRAVEVFGNAGIFYFQAPYRAAAPLRFPRAAGFAQHLANLGFGDDNGLFGHACAWRNLIRAVGPDMIVADFAPTALLAARAFPIRRVVLGSGFCVPPDVEEGEAGAVVWAPMRPAVASAHPEPLREAESEVLTRVNWVLGNWGLSPIDRVGRLFSDADEQFLTTFPELDHFRRRPRAAYWGSILSTEGSDGLEAPEWPTAQGKRVFVYLKGTPVAEEVMGTLKQTGCPTLAFVEGLAPASRERVQGATLRLVPRRLEISRVSRECDVAVLNGGHGVTAEMLLAGKPVLAVPLVLEQQMTGEALRRLGAGESAPPKRGEPWEWTGRAKLEAVLTDERYTQGARRFAERYAKFDPAAQREAMLTRAVELLQRSGAGSAPALAASA